MKKVLNLAIVAGALALTSACNNDRKAENDRTDTTNTDTSMISTTPIPTPAIDSAANAMDAKVDNATFVSKALSGGMLEIELGKVAQKKATTKDSRDFGAQMIADHTKAGNELKAIAGKKNITPPTAMLPEHQEVYDRVSKLSGKEFDTEYVNAMVMDHEKTVALFTKGSTEPEDADIKAFAAKTLPVIQMHTNMAKAMQGKMNGTATGDAATHGDNHNAGTK